MKTLLPRLCALAALVTVLGAQAALAQSAPSRAFPSLRLDPATDVEGIANTQWAAVPDEWGYDAALWLGYENNPLFTYDKTALNTLTRKDTLVENRLSADIVAAVALFNWVQLGVDIPVVLFQDRDATKAPAIDSAALATAGIGDLTLSPKVRVLRQVDGAPFDLGVLLPFTLPTGQFTDYAGETRMTFTPGVAISRTFGRVRLAGNLSHRFRDAVDVPTLQIGSELVYKVGAAYRFDVVAEHQTEVGISLSGAAATDNLFRGGAVPFVGADASDPGRNPAEVLIDVQHRVWGPVDLFVGGGGAILAGFGIPDFRLYAGVRISDRPAYDYDGDGVVGDADRCPRTAGPSENQGCPDVDSDSDGIVDRLDKCPKEAEDKDGFQDSDGCPDLDNDGDGVNDADDKCRDTAGPKANAGCPDDDADGDGIVDRLDKCPKDAEDKDGFQDDDGCPDLDNDNDGIKDRDDQCPMEVGIKQNKGCPDKDRDGDTVVDRLDNCPDEPGPPENGGCAKKQLVVITDAKLEIKDKVFFDTGKDTIQAKSFELLDNVAAVLKSHPELKKIRVEGHTDNTGVPEKNKDLSDRRAKSVVKYLVEKGGVDAARLSAVGYGQERPIATNDTVDGKAQNRRVEFVIVDDEAPATP